MKNKKNITERSDKNLEKSYPDILACIKHKSDEPADHATDDQLMAVLTIVYKS
jgi:hypothetical protein